MENIFGENTKKLGFGMMRLPELSTSGKFGNIDIELTKKWWITLYPRALHTLTQHGCIAASRVRMLQVRHL